MAKTTNRGKLVSRLGGTIDFSKSRRAMGARESWLGQPRANLRKKIKVMRAQYSQAQKAFETFDKTGSVSASAKAAGISRKTARHWLSGEGMPRALSEDRANLYLRLRKPIVIKREKRADFAYVLGAMMGNASTVLLSREKKQGRVDLTVKDRAFAEEFKARLAASTGLNVKIKRVGNGSFVWHNVNFGSRNLVQLFNELSNYGEHVPSKFFGTRSLMRESLAKSKSPTSFLGSREERLEFVRALYDSRGNVKFSGDSKTRVVTIKMANSEVNSFVREALMENGFHPVLGKEGVVTLPSSETESFVRLVGFRKKTSA